MFIKLLVPAWLAVAASLTFPTATTMSAAEAPWQCDGGGRVPLDDSDLMVELECGKSDVIYTAALDLAEYRVPAEDACVGADSVMFVQKPSGPAQHCKIADQSSRQCVFRNLDEGDEVVFTCKGSGGGVCRYDNKIPAKIRFR